MLLGNGNGTFQPPLTYGGGGLDPASIALVDLNGDKKPDLVVANWSLCQQQTWGSVAVRLNNTGAPTTTTSLVSDPNLVAPKKPVTFTATITSQSGDVTGKAVFQDGGVATAVVSLVNSQATYTTSYKKTGTHTISALYSGDLHNAGSVSGTVQEKVVQPPKTVITTSGSPSFVGQPVMFTAILTSTYGNIPDGELEYFYDGSILFGSAALADGKAQYTTSSLSAKTHTIKTVYSGDAEFLPSVGRVVQLVLKFPTTTHLTSNNNPSKYGQAVTFTAKVSASGPYSLTGKVKLWDGTTALGTATVGGGVATLTRSNLAVGTHPIAAQYLGDAFSDKSTSPVVNQVVQ